MSQSKAIMTEVRKNPGQSVEAIAAATNNLRNTTAKHLLRLVVTKKIRRERSCYYRESDARRISQFVYFPVAVKPAAPDNPPPDADQAAPAPAPAPVVEAVALNDTMPLAIDVLRLPLGEAREMYRQLCTIFADKNS